MFKKLAKVFSKDKDVIIWDKKDDAPNAVNREMVFRFPNKEKSDFQGVDKIGVRSYEKAIIYKNGISSGIISGGMYEIEKSFRNLSTEIVWFDTGEVLFPWGVGHTGGMPPLTKDEFMVGGNGQIGIKIFNPEIFITKLVVGQPGYSDELVKKSIHGELTATFRNLVNKFSLKDLVTSEKDDVSIMFNSMLNERLKTLGLEMTTITIQGLAHPGENIDLVNSWLGKGTTDLRGKMEKIEALKDRIKKLDMRMKDLDDKYVDGNVDKEDYNSQTERFKEMLGKYKDELKELEG